MDYFEIINKEELLLKYSTDYSKLNELTKMLSEDTIDFVPDIKDAWSIREHLAHLMDTEIRAFIRYRNAILEPGIELKLGGGDVNMSNTLLNYSYHSVNDSLGIIKLLRDITVQHVSKMTDEEIMKFGIQHPEYGRINLRMIMSIYTQHIDVHIEYIRRNIGLFVSKKRKG